MPIEKLGDNVDCRVDQKSIVINSKLQYQICCARCGDTDITLLRERGKDGKKTNPARYLCRECLRYESVR